MNKMFVVLIALVLVSFALGPKLFFLFGVLFGIAGFIFLVSNRGRRKPSDARERRKQALRAVKRREMSIPKASAAFGVSERDIKNALWVEDLFW